MAGVKVEMTSDVAKLLQGFSQAEAKIARLELKLKKVGKTGREAGEKTGRAMKRGMNEGFGASSQRQITGYVKSLVGVSVAIGVITRAFREMNRASEEAAQKNLAAEMGLAELTQLSGGDPKKLQSLIRQAKSFFGAGGAQNLNQAARTVFSLESAGIPQAQHELFGKLFGISQTPDVLARAATTLQTSLGREETGDIRGIVSKGFAASAFAPARTGPLLEATARGGASAKVLGISDEELLAATTLLAKASGTAEEGGTQIASLLKALTKQEGFIGLGLQESIQRIGSKNLTPPELIKLLGRQEAFKAFSVLRDQPKQFGEILGAVRRAPGEDLVGQLIAARDVQPGLVASLGERKAAAAKEIARGPLGVEQLVGEARIDRFVAQGEATGANRFLLTLQEFNAKFDLVLKNIGLDPSVIGVQQVAPGLSADLSTQDREIIDASREDRLINSADKLDKAAGAMERAAGMIERAVGGGPALKAPGVDK